MRFCCSPSSKTTSLFLPKVIALPPSLKRCAVPNNSGDENYASMYAANNIDAGFWNDLSISSEQRFLMEVEDVYVWSTGDTTTTAELTIASANLNTSSIIWMERLVEESDRTFKNSDKKSSALIIDQ